MLFCRVRVTHLTHCPELELYTERPEGKESPIFLLQRWLLLCMTNCMELAKVPFYSVRLAEEVALETSILAALDNILGVYAIRHFSRVY